MAADFTPNLNPYSGQGSFRFWVQKVLPLVYDDSLSYYELLCKVVTFLNNVIQDMDTAEENIELIRDAYNQLQNYVNSYFDELDVQAEINNKLDEMASDGSLATVIEPYITTELLEEIVTPELVEGIVNEQLDDVVAEQIGGVVAQQIGDTVGTQVTDWLNDNIEPTTPPIDKTLTISEAGADSKVTGDSIGGIDGFSNAELYPFFIDANFVKTSAGHTYEIKRENNMNYYTIIKHATQNSYISFLTASISELATGTNISNLACNGYPARITIDNFGKNNIVALPNDCAYIEVICDNSTSTPNYNRKPALLTFFNDNGIGGYINNRIEWSDDEHDILDKDVATYFNTLNGTNIGLYTRGYLPVWNPSSAPYNEYVVDLDNPVYNKYTGSNVYVSSWVEVTSGETYTISASADGNNSRVWAILNEERKTIQRSGNPLTGLFSVTIPENGKYLITNSIFSYPHFIYKNITVPETFNYDFNGKTVAIIGDSVSTKGAYSEDNAYGCVPEIYITNADVGVALTSYVSYYDVGKTVGGYTIAESDVGNEITFTPTANDVGKRVGTPDLYGNNSSLTDTWWSLAARKYNFNPINVSWSGASISSHEGDKNSYKTSYAWHPSQVRKCAIRTPGTMNRTAPDAIIIYRGINDFSHDPCAKLTPNYCDTYHTGGYPSTDYVTEAGYYGFIEGYVKTIGALRQAYPNTRIIICTLNMFKRKIYNNFPVRNGVSTEYAGLATLPMYNNAIRDIANYMGCDIIEFDKDGITFENATYNVQYFDNPPVHPNQTGQNIMGNRAILDLGKINK